MDNWLLLLLVNALDLVVVVVALLAGMNENVDTFTTEQSGESTR
jgi:hypothetical protein